MQRIVISDRCEEHPYQSLSLRRGIFNLGCTLASPLETKSRIRYVSLNKENIGTITYGTNRYKL
jgi:hypothetical protein